MLIRYIIEFMSSAIITGLIGSVLATIVVLLTRIFLYKIHDMFPARALFKGVAGSDNPFLVFIVRLLDLQMEERYLTPVPRYAVVTQQENYEVRQHIPWVNSVEETNSIGHVLNVLGSAGIRKNIRIVFVDQYYDQWDAPMFILGGNWKAHRALSLCNPHFVFRDNEFFLEAEQQPYQPSASDADLGLLQKMINPTTGYPIWLAMGWRGAGTSAAAHALWRWWKELGILFGSKTFGLLLEMNDRDGWQQYGIVRLYPSPRWYKKILHPLSWRRIKRCIIRREVNN